MKKLDPRALLFFFFDFFASTAGFALLVVAVLSLFMVQRSVGSFSDIISGQLSLGSISYNQLVYNFVGLFILYLVLVLVWTILYYINYNYELTEDSLKQQFGVISRKYTGVPYDNIQDVDIDQSIIMRFLGIATVSVETASKDPGEERSGTSLFAVSIGEAKYLRDEIMKRVDAHK